jgi:hypothetical protein
MTRTLKVLCGTAALAVFTAACGGGASSPTGGTPQPGPGNPGANPAPPPAPAPTPDPRASLPNGPVTRFTIKVRTVNNGERDAVQDGSGRFVVHPGERVDFDSTQKNAGGEICKWVNDPEWTINQQACPAETTCANGVVFRRGSSQPFLLKTTIERLGTFTVQGSIDGVTSNVLDMVSTPN